MGSPSELSASWLPTHQEHAFFTTAHVDGIVGSLAEVLSRYQRDDPVEMGRRFTETEKQLVLVGIKPLPEVVSRLFADALNAARNSMEHALFAEVTHRIGRPLSDAESKALEVPATVGLDQFDTWARHKHRASLGLLSPRDEIYERLLRLQPLQRKESSAHPLSVLVAHTNYSKHREPAVALTRVARVVRDSDRTRKPLESLEVVQVGDILGSVPRGTREEFSVWPEVAVQRPHTKQWFTLMKEVGEVVEWVRAIALPILISGRTDLPQIPPQLDIAIAHESLEVAWRSAGQVPAAKRMQNAIGAEGLRASMLEMLVDQFGETARSPFLTWLTAMDDATIMARMWPVLERSARGDLGGTIHAFNEWATEAGVPVPENGATG